MTTQAQKESEVLYVRMLVDGLFEYRSLETRERPDIWIRRSGAPDIGVEVTEYHPEAQLVSGGVRRVEVESRWWSGLMPLLEQAKKERPSLENVQVTLSFNDHRLPRSGKHATLVREIIQAAESLASQVPGAYESIKVYFLPRESVKLFGGRLGREMLLAKEDWPEASHNLSFLEVCRWPGIRWPPCSCPQVTGALLGIELSEVCRILQAKSTRARDYTFHDSPLWLLIVCELFGDLQSFIFPHGDAELSELLMGIEKAGFEFRTAPFREVWMLSASSHARLRIHPRPS